MTIETRAYTLEDLALAVTEYKHFLGKYQETEKKVAADQARLDSARRDMAQAKEDLVRQEKNVMKIAREVSR